nr:hypothetical protein [Ensifer aridi]
MVLKKSLKLGFSLVLAALGSTWARAADVSPLLAQDPQPAEVQDGWTFSIAPYFWMAGLSGETSQFGLPTVDIDADFGDILDHLDFAFMAAGEARYDRFSIIGDVIYTKLSANGETPLGILANDVDVKQKASAEAALAQAQVELDKTVVRAGTGGMLQQFALRPGDVVNPMIRCAGILVPDDRRIGLIAGFGQIEAQVMKPGMIAEATCVGKPFTIIPMVVTEVQEVIATGQIRPTDQLADVQQMARPGTLTTFLEPLFDGQFTGIPPGSSCIANAYTSNHDELHSPDISTPRWLFLHMVDTVGLVHAMILRLQALLLPVQTLVLTGH